MTALRWFNSYLSDMLHIAPLLYALFTVLHASHVKSNHSDVMGWDFRACLVCVFVETVLSILLLNWAWLIQKRHVLILPPLSPTQSSSSPFFFLRRPCFLMPRPQPTVWYQKRRVSVTGSWVQVRDHHRAPCPSWETLPSRSAAAAELVKPGDPTARDVLTLVQVGDEVSISVWQTNELVAAEIWKSSNETSDSVSCVVQMVTDP